MNRYEIDSEEVAKKTKEERSMKLRTIVSCVVALGLCSTTGLAWEFGVAVQQNSAYELGGYELDNGTEVRFTYAIPLDEVKSNEGFGTGLGLDNWCLGTGDMGTPPGGILSPPRIEFKLGFETVMDDVGGGEHRVMTGYDMYGRPQYSYVSTGGVDLDLYRTTVGAGIGWRIDPGEAVGSPPKEEKADAFFGKYGYGDIGFGVSVDLSYYYLDDGHDTESDIVPELSAYIDYKYPITERLRAGIKLDASYLLIDPDLGSDLEAKDTVRLGGGLIVDYSF